MVDNEKDDLWQVMGKARRIEPNPRFTDNVIRVVERLDQEPPSRLPLFLKWFWGFAGAGAAALLLVTFVGPSHQPAADPSVAATPIPTATPVAFEAVPTAPTPSFAIESEPLPRVALTNAAPAEFNASLSLTNQSAPRVHDLDVIQTDFQPSGALEFEH